MGFLLPPPFALLLGEQSSPRAHLQVQGRSPQLEICIEFAVALNFHNDVALFEPFITHTAIFHILVSKTSYLF